MIYRCSQGSSVSVDTQLILNKKLSAEARLILIIILTHSDNHRFSPEELVKESGLSMYKVNKALKELKENNYLQYKHTSASDGRFNGVEWIVKENPNYEPSQPVVQPEVILEEVITAEQFNFNQFWDKYPKKVNRDQALKEFLKIPDVNTVFPDIMRALEIQINSTQWKEEGGRYIPNPENYLRKAGWNNVIDTNCLVEAAFQHLEDLVYETQRRNI